MNENPCSNQEIHVLFEHEFELENILSVKEKLPVSKFRLFRKYIIQLFGYCSCFWSTTSFFGEIKQLHEPWNYGARDARAFYVFRSF